MLLTERLRCSRTQFSVKNYCQTSKILNTINKKKSYRKVAMLNRNIESMIHHCRRHYCGNPYRQYELKKRVTKKEIRAYADLTGDYNPVHLQDNVIHGTFLLGLISGVIATNHPHAKMLDISANFKQSCHADTEIFLSVNVPIKTRKISLAVFKITDIEKGESIVDGNVKILFSK